MSSPTPKIVTSDADDKGTSIDASNVVAAGGEGGGCCLDKDNGNVIAEDAKDEDKLPNLIVKYSDMQTFLAAYLGPIGMDAHPFLIGWYNEKVGPKFRLNYPDDTVAFVLISGPEMFEKCMVPYAKFQLGEDPNFRTENPLDDSMKHAFGILKEDLKEEGLEVDMFHDFDLFPSRKPKVLVQTAAHVAGAVQYLHKNFLPKDVQDNRFSRKSNLSGVAIHPKYGGWYAIRGIVIFTNVRLPEGGKELQKPEPVEIFTSQDAIAEVIEQFAYNWQQNGWRDMHEGSSGEKYSDAFVKYLSLETPKRWAYVKECCDNNHQSD